MFSVSRNRSLLLFVELVFCLLICIFSLSYFIENSWGVYSKYVLFATYTWVVITGLSRYTISHSYILFLLSFGVFLMGRVFLDIFFREPLDFADKWMAYWLSPNTSFIVNISMAFSLMFCSIGTYLNVNIKKQHYSYDPQKVYKFTLLLIILLLPFCVGKVYMDLLQIVKNGYTTLYSGINRAPFIFRLGWFLTKLLFPILFVFTNNKKTFLKVLVLYLIINSLEFAQGARGALFRPLAFYLWYYYKFVSINKLKLRVAAIFGSFIILSSTLLLVVREDSDIDTSPLSSINYFVTSLSGSYYVQAYYVDFKEKFTQNNSGMVFLFGPVIDYVRSFYDSDIRGHSKKRVEKGLILDHKISYEISQKSYLDGHGLGGCYIVEMFAFGGVFGVMLWSFWLGAGISFFEKFSLVFPHFRIIAWFWIQNLVWMSRSSFLSFIAESALSVILFFIIVKIKR